MLNNNNKKKKKPALIERGADSLSSAISKITATELSLIPGRRVTKLLAFKSSNSYQVPPEVHSPKEPRCLQVAATR